MKHIIKLLLSSILLSAYATANADDTQNSKSVVEQILAAQITIANGPYQGLRINHNKGIVTTGTFMPFKNAASITKAAHLQNTPSKITVRFSNAGGVPTIKDTDQGANPRGIAIRFELPDGTMTDIVGLSVHAFPVSTPEDFLAFLNARIATKSDTEKPTPLEKIIASNPALQRFLAIPKPFPRSFASQNYFGINAFEFTNAAGEKRYIRYKLSPVQGTEFLNPEELKKATDDYLFDELTERFSGKKTSQPKIQFKLLAQVAQNDDDVDDPSVVWPENREYVELGILSITDKVADNAVAEKSLAFNPLILVDGIAPSHDPVLLARPAAYAISVSRRLLP